MNLKLQSLGRARKPVFSFAAFALCGSLALAQPPAAPTQPPAPVERQSPSDQMGGRGMGPGMGPGMHRGMGSNGMQGGMRGPQGGPGNFRASGMEGRGNFHGGPGRFHGGPEGRGMEGGFHIGPGGMWWKNPMIVQRLTLTPEQGRKMDGIFQESRLQLIDLKANVEKQEVILEPLLSANPLDTARAMDQIDKVAQSRADLEKANAKMLLGIRAVLTPEQWTKLNERRGPGDFRPQAGPASTPPAPAGRTRGLRGGTGNSPNARPGTANTPQ
jgi:Spy/CpxP family protein refolding chaperone